MLTCRGSVHFNRQTSHPLCNLFEFFHFLLVFCIDDNKRVKITVADMTDDRRKQVIRFDLLLAFNDTFRQSGNRYANIRYQDLASGSEVFRGGQSIVPITPKLVALLLRLGPAKMTAAEFFDYLRGSRYLVLRFCFVAVKLY